MVSCSVFLPPPMVWVPLGGGLERCTIYSSCDSGSQKGTWVTCRAWSFKYMGMHPFKFGSLRWPGTYLGYVKFKVPHSTTPRWRDWIVYEPDIDPWSSDPSVVVPASTIVRRVVRRLCLQMWVVCSMQRPTHMGQEHFRCSRFQELHIMVRACPGCNLCS